MVPGIINVQGKFLVHIHVLSSRAEVSHVHSKSSRSCSAAATHAGPTKSKKKKCGWTGSLNTHGAAHAVRVTAARGAGRESGAPCPLLGKRKICFSFSAGHENGCAHGWDPILATNTPVGNWLQGAGSSLSFIRELLSVCRIVLCGGYCFPADTWHYV